MRHGFFRFGPKKSPGFCRLALSISFFPFYLSFSFSAQIPEKIRDRSPLRFTGGSAYYIGQSDFFQRTKWPHRGVTRLHQLRSDLADALTAGSFSLAGRDRWLRRASRSQRAAFPIFAPFLIAFHHSRSHPFRADHGDGEFPIKVLDDLECQEPFAFLGPGIFPETNVASRPFPRGRRSARRTFSSCRFPRSTELP